MPYTSGLLAVGSQRSGFWDGPYVDARGDTDIGIRRSVRLFLSQNKYDHLRHILIRGSIQAEIIRQNQKSGKYVVGNL